MKLGGSLTILRYLGKLYGYYPEDPVAAAKVDMLIDSYSDIFNGIAGAMFASGDDKSAKIKEVFEKTLPGFMKIVDPFLKETGFLVGNKLTIADFYIGGLYVSRANDPNIGFASEEWANFKTAYPKFTLYGERVAAANKAYLDGRPGRPF